MRTFIYYCSQCKCKYKEKSESAPSTCSVCSASWVRIDENIPGFKWVKCLNPECGVKTKTSSATLVTKCPKCQGTSLRGGEYFVKPAYCFNMRGIGWGYIEQGIVKAVVNIKK